MPNESNEQPAEPNAAANQPPQDDLTGREVYNAVTDTVGGVNFRISDNMFQAIFVVVSVLVLAAVGAILAAVIPSWDLPWFGGAIAGAFAGLVIGIFTSGIFLMIYRGLRHLRGKHD